MEQFTYLLLLGLLLVIAKLLIEATSKKVKKLESEMDENDFEMKPVTGGLISGIVSIIWAVAVMFIHMRMIFFARGRVFVTIGMVGASFIVLAFVVWFAWETLRQSREKIIVKGNTITQYKSQRKAAQITFDEISKIKFGESKKRSRMNFHGMDDEIIFTISDSWVGQSLLIKRLIYSGKAPLLATPVFLKNTPYKYKKLLENFLNTTTALINFLIEEGLIINYSFDENGLVDIDFELYYHDLTAEGQRLFTPTVIDKWYNTPLKDKNITDFILFLKNALMEIRGGLRFED